MIVNPAKTQPFHFLCYNGILKIQASLKITQVTFTRTAIQIAGLTKHYRSGLFSEPVKALDHLDLTVYQGEIFGYLGPNGAGKTTTIRLMLNFIRPTEGQCLIFGRDAWRDAVTIKNDIGNLPAELQLWEHMTGSQIIHYLAQLRPGCDTRYAMELAERLLVDLHVPIGQFSTGNKRKIGIIQALMHKPALVIMDEPTNGLDPLMRRVLADLLLEARNEGRTVFLSSHVLSEVQSLCDRVAILRRGQLQKVDSIRHLTQHRWIFVSTPDQIVPEILLNVDGVESVVPIPNGYRLQVNGSLDRLIKFMANYRIDDFRVEEPSLEDVFAGIYAESS